MIASVINTVQQLYNHLPVPIIKFHKEEFLNDYPIDIVQQLYNHLSVLIIKFQKGEILMIPSLTQYNSYATIYQFQLSKFKKKIKKLSNFNNFSPQVIHHLDIISGSFRRGIDIVRLSDHYQF